MNEPVTLRRQGGIVVLCIDNPPVNAISPAVIAGLEAALARLEEDAAYDAMLVQCAGRTFVAGGDIAVFDDPGFSARPFNRVLAALEALDRPVVAAMHGTVLGGGLELAMACHYRVCVAGTRFGMPEVKLGLLPGSLGTQRLPRLVGAELALDLISSGKMIDAQTARQAGLVDELVDSSMPDAALAYAARLVRQQAGPRRASVLEVSSAGLPPAYFDDALLKAEQQRRFYPAARAVVRAVSAAASLPFAQGEQLEAQLFEELRLSPESRAMRHVFFAEREAAKVPGLIKDTLMRTIGTAGVLGAGTMGTGIAMALLNGGLTTVLIERSPDQLERGLDAIRNTYDAAVLKGKLDLSERDARLGRLTSSVDDAPLAQCDLVIEAIFEDMALKKQVWQALGPRCKPGAVLATNTSTLDVDALAVSSGRPADFVGMHFFSPANVMRLLEVVRGKDTASDVLATVMQLARRIQKVAVVSGVCYGFIGNRMAEVYMREAEFLLMEGASPAQIDQAVEALGMAMGPCRMLDLAGIDVGAKTVIEYGKTGGLPPDSSYRAVVRKLFELGRHGQKAARGYYRYQGRKAIPDPEVDAIFLTLAAKHGIARRQQIADQEIVERLLYPLINEGAKILQEGIAYRPGDIDVVWTSGYGFPDHKGGPMFLADEIGVGVIVERLHHYAQQRGNAFGYWDVAELLQEHARGVWRISDRRANVHAGST